MGGRTLHVGIDISSAVDARPTGIARYIHSLVSHLEQLESPPQLSLYCRASRFHRFDPGALFGGRTLRPLPLWLRGVDLFHATDVRLPLLARTPSVVTIHDLSMFERDDHATPRFLRKKRASVERAVRRATTLITQSQSVRDAIVARFSIPDTSVAVIPLASGLPLKSDRPIVDVAGAVRRLLIVGGPSVRKGEARLSPLLSYWDREFDWQPDLDWVGSGSAVDQQRLLESVPSAARHRIHFHGHVDEARLDRLYRECDGFLQISDTEGFAMPLLEAAERGCPILSIDSPVLRETSGGFALFFGDNVPASRESFESFLAADHRRGLRESARQHAAAFTWHRTAERTARVYTDAAARAR